ncbi:TRAP transporter fused permease subunit [Thalassobacillus sp. CUG 92003]|uniref:TRAP transporter permease n=1 Tax=Thalassobacillus sp. CUG 92003 TaxID=2736641 RepID=UPI0015E79A4F|nr:TRAP transporter fused permease subunit [Thalassobacillus sp. CUG 92003]
MNGSNQYKFRGTQKENSDSVKQKHRTFENRFTRILWLTILGLIPTFGILYMLGVHQSLGISLYGEQYVGLFLALILSAIYMSVPRGKHSPKDRVPWYDWILSVLGLFAGLYITFFYPNLVMTIGTVTTERFIISVVAILLILEAIRRVLGKGLLIVVLVFMVYGYFAPHLPGIFRGSGSSVRQLFNFMYLDSSSLMDLLNIAASIALSFIIFGQILLFFGGSDILNKFAISTFGRFRGGPAKGSILGSSLVGSITGGPVANVVLTGSVTIPLMKKGGYSSAQAGGIESVASTGGSVMPPVMGVAAFIIAETLGIPYSEVALAALVPALLYYACLFFQVDFIAGRKGLGRVKKEDIPNIRDVLKKGWLILAPLGALVYFLFFEGYSPAIAGVYASVIAVISLSIQKTIRGRILKLLLYAFVESGRVMLDIGIVLAAAGLVVGITGVTGLGFNLGFMLSNLADHGLLLLLVVSAIVSIILGMGMPAVAAYALVAVLVAPAIVDLGVNPLSAHLFVYYFAILSSFTPPVAMACFTAAPLAKESPNKIAFQSIRLGIVGYLVPFLFVYAPGLLLGPGSQVPWLQSTFIIVTAVIGCFLLAMALEGFLFQHLNGYKRLIASVLAVCLFLPHSTWEYSWIVNCIAFIVTVFFILIEWKSHRKVRESPVIAHANEA